MEPRVWKQLRTKTNEDETRELQERGCGGTNLQDKNELQEERKNEGKYRKRRRSKEGWNELQEEYEGELQETRCWNKLQEERNEGKSGNEVLETKIEGQTNCRRMKEGNIRKRRVRRT